MPYPSILPIHKSSTGKPKLSDDTYLQSGFRKVGICPWRFSTEKLSVSLSVTPVMYLMIMPVYTGFLGCCTCKSLILGSFEGNAVTTEKRN